MNNSATKFQQLLRELFQFDCADLDFGIYRIMNYKRSVIERFINEDLPKAIAEELKQGALAEQAKAAENLKAAYQKVLEALGEEALDADGNLAAQYQNTRAGKEYLTARERAEAAKGSAALEAAVYNHLYTFFSRYWQDGDFISKRRYSKKERYAIPYNGEEVMLYWANHDQYYVKTGEYFTDYTWKAPNGVTVHFKLQAADVEQDNIKGEKRFFLPLTDEIAWDVPPLPSGERAGVRGVLTIPFHFRPLTAQEAIAYGQKNQQGAILAKALEEIPKKLVGKEKAEAPAALLAEKRRADGSTISLLEHHLRQYTRRNTSDFFIHKDLRGFLQRELDFYLKSEVLNLDEMEAAGEGLAEGWFQLLRLTKRVGGHIIEFLAQIEDFQKMLWEKRKFITETFYVITLGNIPEEFYPEIAACEAQWEEWEALLHVSQRHREHKEHPGDSVSSCEERIVFLKAHPALPLDTRHFSPDFVDRLLASYDDLDEMTDGLLVHSENWQALNLLVEKYRERVKCIYIDPPYNTGNDDFVYRDGYQHSSWISMMRDRAGVHLLSLDGVFFCSISDHEVAHLRMCLDRLFGESNLIGSIAWNATKTVTNTALISVGHIYNVVYARDIDYFTKHRYHFRLPDPLQGFANPDDDPRGPWKADPFQVGGIRPNQQYEIVNTKTGKVYRPNPGCSWKNDYETFKRLMAEGRIVFGKTGEGGPQRKRYLYEAEERGRVATTWWDDVETTADGTRNLQDLFNEAVFTNPKPVPLLKKIFQLGTYTSEQVILDYFAGSGTTGHAVINLNREDGGRRKFILVEMAHYFDTVLLPRIKKVTFSPEWKDGQPKRMATAEEAERGPRLVKVIRLESYEDALNNLSFDGESGQVALQLEDYLLQYMLKWETRKSETLLNVEKLQTPFSYKLHIHRDGETREQSVDLPETFNYLIGLDVETRCVLPSPLPSPQGGEGAAEQRMGGQYLVYRGTTREGRRVVVIWRETAGWTEDDYRRDRDVVADNHLTDGADEVFVNGDSLIPGARALEAVFKARMFAGVEE